MIFFKFGDQLHIHHDGETYEVYDCKQEETPLKFYLRIPNDSDINNLEYYLIVVIDNEVKVNFGTLEQILLAEWKSYDISGREVLSHYVIDDMLSVLFSDMSSVVIDLINQTVHEVPNYFIISTLHVAENVRRLIESHGNQYIRDMIKPPLVDMHYESVGSVLRVAVRRSSDGKYDLDFYHHGFNGRTNLYLNSVEPVKDEGVDALKHDSLVGVSLLNDGTLRYVAKYMRYNKFDDVDQVHNFFIPDRLRLLYIIRNDKLQCKDLSKKQSEWITILEEGASKIIFPTESEYDYELLRG